MKNKTRNEAIKSKLEQLKILHKNKDPSTLKEIMKIQKELHVLKDQEDLKWK